MTQLSEVKQVKVVKGLSTQRGGPGPPRRGRAAEGTLVRRVTDILMKGVPKAGVHAREKR